LLLFSLLAGGSMTMLLRELVHRRVSVQRAPSVALTTIGCLVILRAISFFTDYHNILDELPLFRPINLWEGFVYSLGDFLIDAGLFTLIAVLIARTRSSPDLTKVSRLEANVISVGSYLILILTLGLFAWVQRMLVMYTSLPLELEQISFVNLNNAAVFTGFASILFGVFVVGQRLLRDLPALQPSLYRRIVDLVIASLLSLAFISMLDLNLPLFGFYLAVLSLLILFDLFNESTNRSVIWVICWSMLIAGFEASLLHNYQNDRDQQDRLELAVSLADELSGGGEIEDVMIQRLPGISSRYSIGIFKDSKLAYNYNFTYPLVLPERKEASAVFTMGNQDRSEMGFADGALTVLIGKRNIGLMQVVSLFSYIFALFNIFLFFITLGNSFFRFLPEWLSLSFSSRPTLRNRIQVAIVFLIILSFVIIGFVTVFYLRNTSEDKDKKYFEDRLRAIATSIAQAVPSADSLQQNETLIPRIAGIAYVYNRRAKIYDEDGSLILQNADHADDAQRPSIKMSFVSKFEMDQSQRSYSVEETDYNSAQAYKGMLALRDDTGRHYGYIEMPGTAMVQVQADTGSKFFGTILNAYVFLFLIAVALAIGVANSITRPLAQLGEKLKQLNIGRKNDEIQWGIDDEIGGLIKDYNAMINKLDESAQLLALTERDMAWREMAKQVAHEIKNPLTPMKLSIQYLQSGMDHPPEKLRQLVKRVSDTLIEQIENLSTIASEFSNFATMPQAANDKVLLNEIVASVHDLFRKREDMDIQLYVPIQDIYVFADRNQVVRVLNNVIKNAIQAIPDDKRGNINISLEKRRDKALIIIKDNGTGISDEMKDKVFRPNFTTKSSGTGLGLAISANIVETFNGRIYFETEEGKGTKFFVEIPLMKLDDTLKEEERVLL
ncbi:MAG: HAMP domain-containing sensor histidine kinase, partial [Saprospiraceae bacterium]|nr:HAMP domain-containing sensor histidine kinase [Saprospiraceae bacterium]